MVNVLEWGRVTYLEHRKTIIVDAKCPVCMDTIIIDGDFDSVYDIVFFLPILRCWTCLAKFEQGLFLPRQPAKRWIARAKLCEQEGNCDWMDCYREEVYRYTPRRSAKKKSRNRKQKKIWQVKGDYYEY